MFRMNSRESAASAKAYYTEKARQDYYSEGQEILGNWGGIGAERLGLKGTVDRDAFVALCDNVNPSTGESLTLRTKSKRIVGYDMNFHCPKSVSVVYAWNVDPNIMKAFRNAVQETMQDAEKLAMTRVRINGQPDGDRPTGNLIWAEFVHLTARPEDQIPDPHLHAHCFTFNATFDEVEDRWKAARFMEINRNAPLYQGMFMTRLANNLMAAGYNIRRVDNAFEIVGVPDEVIEYFSKRTAQIKKTAAALGITDPKELDRLGALTRKVKSSDISFKELRGLWQRAVSPGHQETLNRFRRPHAARVLETVDAHKVLDAVIESPHEKSSPRLGKTAWALAPKSALSLQGQRINPPLSKEGSDVSSVARAAIDRSILHNFYRASVVRDSDILTHAMRLAYGTGLSPEQIQQAMYIHPEFIFGEIKGQRLVTTQSVLAEERANIKWVKEGKGILPPILAGHQIKDTKLNDEQRAAVMHVLNSTDRVTAIDGKAGTGKTTLMREAVAALEADHQRVLVLAPETPAVQETLKKGGFPNAQTVQMLLVNEKLQGQYRGAVIWVDEAGQLSSRSLHQLINVAEKLGARVVVSGDVMQHRAVERGDALRMLYEYAELKPVVVTKILRQKGDYREMMELLSQGNLTEAFKKMDASGCIQEIPFEQRYKAIAARYVQLVREGRNPGVIAPTHEEGRMVTQEVRAALKQAGMLGKHDTPIERLRQLDITPADRADWRSYRPGWIIEYIKDTQGTRAGTRRVIDSIDYETGNIYVKVQVGATKTATHNLDLEEYANHFQIYQSEELQLAPGDLIRITKNGPTEYGPSRVYRGSEHIFVGFDEHGDLKLDDGMVLKRDYAHLTHGITSTSHGAQSKTMKHVIVAQSVVSNAAASIEQFYVSTSRGSVGMDIFTDSKAGLFEAVETSSQRRSAMDLVSPKPEKKAPQQKKHKELQQPQNRPAKSQMPKEPRKKIVGEPRSIPTRKSEIDKPAKKVNALKASLGEKRELPRPAKPKRLKRELGERNVLPKPENVEPLWRMPVPKVKEPEPLWRMPVIAPIPLQEAIQPEIDEDLDDDMLPPLTF